MIVGIDLGTSTSQVAVLRNGKPVIIENPEGDLSTPSIVALTQDGEWIFGEKAKAQQIANSLGTVIEAKRVIGDPYIRYFLANQSFTPKEIIAKLLEYIKHFAEASLGTVIDRAVITVPAYFSSRQRQEVFQAASMASLEAARLINEPTAAAMAYGLNHLKEHSFGLVYDFGGGTFDVTVLELYEGVMEVKASSGNNRLGGKDIDELIIDLLKREFEARYKEAITDDDIKSLSYLKQRSEEAKIGLSSHESVHISIPFIKSIEGKPVSIEYDLERKELNRLITHLVDKTMISVQKALRDSGVKKDDLSFLLLVGGTTRIPYVRDRISDFLKLKPLKEIDPEFAVVTGAAIQTGLMSDDYEKLDDLIVTDICPYALGTAAVLQSGDRLIDGFLDILIEENSTIPKTVVKVYQTVHVNQRDVRITAYQKRHDTDSRMAEDHLFLGEFVLTGIPEAPAGHEEVQISFTYNLNGILEVEGMIVSTGERKRLTIKNIR